VTGIVAEGAHRITLYRTGRRHALTRFREVAGAPLDNNLVCAGSG